MQMNWVQQRRRPMAARAALSMMFIEWVRGVYSVVWLEYQNPSLRVNAAAFMADWLSPSARSRENEATSDWGTLVRRCFKKKKKTQKDRRKYNGHNQNLSWSLEGGKKITVQTVYDYLHILFVIHVFFFRKKKSKCNCKKFLRAAGSCPRLSNHVETVKISGLCRPATSPRAPPPCTLSHWTNNTRVGICIHFKAAWGRSKGGEGLGWDGGRGREEN